MAVPTWNLNDIVEEKQIPSHIDEIKHSIEELEQYKEQFTPEVSEGTFKEIMEKLESLVRKVNDIGVYASAWLSEDTNNQEAQALYGKISALGVEQQNRLMFLNQGWKRFDEENIERLLKAVPEFDYYLRTIYSGKKHMLSDEEETIISIKDLNGSEALNKIYELIASNFEFEFAGKTLPVQELLEFVRSNDREQRKKAYEALFVPYKKNKDVLGNIYTHVIDDWRREAELRNFPHSISVRNDNNDIPDAAVQALLKTCKKNAHVFQQYFTKKAELLGIDSFSRYDLYAPMKKSEQKISFDEAVGTILEVFESFHPDFAAAAKRVVDENHIHATIQKGKRTGAYCTYPNPDKTPYVFLSYTGSPETVNTLAHELGHAVHGVLAQKQNMFHHHAALPVCETASIFSELLLEERLKEKNPELAKSMTLTQVDGLYASIMRQSFFVMFEETAHEMVKENPTIDELNIAYRKNLQEQFGDIDIPEDFNFEWMYIPHIFHTPFYCYAYSFGNLLSLALYDQYKKDPAFADTVVDFLSKGGSQSPYDMVKATGFDISDESFWQGGFDVIQKMIDDL